MRGSTRGVTSATATKTSALTASATSPVLSDLKTTGAAGNSVPRFAPVVIVKASTAPPARMPAKAACLLPKGFFIRLNSSEGSSCVSRLDAKMATATMVVPPRSTKCTATSANRGSTPRATRETCLSVAWGAKPSL
ncbi:hypothetical protein D3C72_937540 [compost metagenome]